MSKCRIGKYMPKYHCHYNNTKIKENLKSNVIHKGNESDSKKKKCITHKTKHIFTSLKNQRCCTSDFENRRYNRIVAKPIISYILEFEKSPDKSKLLKENKK